MGGAQLLARVDAAALAAQPLAVEQVGAGELRTQRRSAEPLDRLAVERVGGRPLAQQSSAARLDAEREVSPAAFGRLRQSLERIVCELGGTSARRGAVLRRSAFQQRVALRWAMAALARLGRLLGYPTG